MINANVSRNNPTWRWIAIAGCLGLLVAVFVQWHAIWQLHRENELLRAQPQPPPMDVPSQPTVSGGGGALDVELSQKDRGELLRLRNEVRQLREQVARPALDGSPVASQTATRVAPGGQYRDDEVRQLGAAATRGDSAALDKLAKLTAAARVMDTNEQAVVLSDIRLAFEALGTEAGKGSTAALQAVWRASRMRDLQGFAVSALGQAAGLGNEEALKPLLDPEGYLILRSSAVAALQPAADAGNARAIQALAAVASDQKQQALWFLAAQGLESSAVAGNSTAIDALASLAATQDQNVRRQAILALEAAARKPQPQAEEALRKLGWR